MVDPHTGLTPEQELAAMMHLDQVRANPRGVLHAAMSKIIDECHDEFHKPPGERDYDQAFRGIVMALQCIQVWMQQQDDL